MLVRRSARAAILVVICGGALIGPGETMAASGTPQTASAPLTANARVTAKVNALGGLSVRTGPGTGHRRVTVLGNSVRLRVVCRVGGETVTGSARRTAVWDRLSNGLNVSDAYVVWRPARPRLALCSHRATVRAAAAGSLNVRRTASTDLARTGMLRHGTRLSVVCQLAGEHVNGPVRRTAVGTGCPTAASSPTPSSGGGSPVRRSRGAGWAARSHPRRTAPSSPGRPGRHGRGRSATGCRSRSRWRRPSWSPAGAIPR